MSTDKENLDYERVEAFLKSPAGFWTVIAVLAAIVVGIVIQNVSRFVG